MDLLTRARELDRRVLGRARQLDLRVLGPIAPLPSSMDHRTPRWFWLRVTPRTRASAALNLVALPAMTAWLVFQVARGRYGSSVVLIVYTTAAWFGLPATWHVLQNGNDRIPPGSPAAAALRRQVGVMLVFMGLLFALLLVMVLVV